ncbi:cytochrome c biogenesis protein CcdA [Halohasta litorea]|uniref:Cytochrome c biogenesis protein CcdA n=1 Tax=Halohasta litorea TaxID=869891 RepID=A0ABD6D4S3_9EURY|nr:cytochrome c biogenesis protein CcdA [Halohasta litorea]
MNGTLLNEIGLAVGTGVATFFSPCAYALLPGYVGVYLGASGDDQSLVDDAVYGLAAAVGVLVVVGLTIAAVAAVGEPVRELVTWIEPLTGIALIGFGLLLLRGSAVGWHIPLPEQRSGVVGFGLFGAVYAIAAVGCVAPLFFGLVLNALRSGVTQSMIVIGAYGGTIAALLLGSTFAIGMGYELTELKLARLSVVGRRLGGGLLVVAGAVQLALTI